MPGEEEKRLHRCCFSGQRPEKLTEAVDQIKIWLSAQIDAAIADGFTTFISGCAMGVDIWAAQIVLQKKRQNPALRLIAATPWPGFSSRWNTDWQAQYNDLLKRADLVVPVCSHYHDGVFQQRNEWMVDHSSRLVAYYNGAPGGTKNMVEYAERKGIRIITNNPVYSPKRKREKQMESEKIPYPENLLRDIGPELISGTPEHAPLSDDQQAGLAQAIQRLQEREQEIIRLRYQEKNTLQQIGDRYGLSRERIRQLLSKALRKLRHPSRIAWIRDGFEKTELALKIACANEIRKQLLVQRKRYPRMTEADVVKFVFQGMLGVGHLIRSEQSARERLSAEMAPLQPGSAEPLTEKISTEWVRLNLRPAKAQGVSEEDIARRLIRSAERATLSFTRQNVYNFCVKLDGSEEMKAAAAKVLDESWLPGHSEAYRAAYHPAYRVLHKEYGRFTQNQE